MRQNWDFVSMEDYQSDMLESSETAVAVINMLRKERDQWKLLAAALVLSAGGKVGVSEYLTQRDDLVFGWEYDMQEQKIIYTAAYPS